MAAPPAAAPTAGRSRQVFSAAPHGPASGGGGSVTLSRADYDALLERMQNMENEITSLRVRSKILPSM